MGSRRRTEAHGQAGQDLARGAAREHHAHLATPRRGAGRREIAEIDQQGLPPHRFGTAHVEANVHAVDQHVGGDHHVASVHADDRAVVPRPYAERPAAGDQGDDARNPAVLVVGVGGTRHRGRAVEVTRRETSSTLATVRSSSAADMPGA